MPPEVVALQRLPDCMIKQLICDAPGIGHMTELDTRLRSDLLYLSIDMPKSPTYEQFADQVALLKPIVAYSVEVIPLRASYLGERLSLGGLRIVRTSMASPWVTVLTELTETSAPMAYGVGVLFSLHKLMVMVMEWQNHQQSLKERREDRHRLESQSDLQLDVASRMGRTFSESGRVYPHVEKRAAEAIVKLNNVVAAEMADAEDPRAQGQE